MLESLRGVARGLHVRVTRYRLLCCPQPPLGCLPDHARLTVVVGHQFGVRLGHLREALRQDAGNTKMMLLTGTAEQRLIGRVSYQRVLEAVGGPRRIAGLIEKLSLHEPLQVAPQSIGVECADSTEEIEAKLASDARGELGHP